MLLLIGLLNFPMLGQLCCMDKLVVCVRLGLLADLLLEPLLNLGIEEHCCVILGSRRLVLYIVVSVALFNLS